MHQTVSVSPPLSPKKSCVNLTHCNHIIDFYEFCIYDLCNEFVDPPQMRVTFTKDLLYPEYRFLPHFHLMPFMAFVRATFVHSRRQ